MVDWSVEEVDLVIGAYFEMLQLELRGQAYNKSQMRRELTKRIPRSEGSVEFKLANISAALIEVGGIPINGYRPRWNIQQLLRERVAEQFGDDVGLRLAMLKSVSSSYEREQSELAEPSPVPPAPVQLKQKENRRGRFIDYREIEARNRNLGLAGEQAVVRLEQRRLRRAGADRLAEQVRHVAIEDGDGLGYDVRSFDASGRERFIEVKTTRSVREIPFFVTRNEVSFSAEVYKQFELYRLFNFGNVAQGFYVLPGSLERSASLDPVLYSGLPNGSSIGA